VREPQVVGVQERDPLGGGRSDTRVARGRHTAAVEAQRARAVARGQLARPVHRTVVDDDHLTRWERLSGDRPERGRKRRRRITRRDDDGHVELGRHGPDSMRRRCQNVDALDFGPGKQSVECRMSRFSPVLLRWFEFEDCAWSLQGGSA